MTKARAAKKKYHRNTIRNKQISDKASASSWQTDNSEIIEDDMEIVDDVEVEDYVEDEELKFDDHHQEVDHSKRVRND